MLAVMDQFTRRLVGVGVRAARSMAPTSAACSTPPSMVGAHRDSSSTDHDPLFEAHRWTANLRILEIEEIKTVPMPLSHPFVERLIGTVRREFLDQVLFWNARDLERKLADFQTYYNAARSHALLQGHTPSAFAGGHTVTAADLNNALGSSLPGPGPAPSGGVTTIFETDTWYEMLTGRVAFGGDTLSDTIAAILDREPEWPALPAATPAPIRRLLLRCLDKDAKRRLRDIGDVRTELDDLLSGAIMLARATP